MTCTKHSDVAVQYVSALRRGNITLARTTLAQYMAVLSATKEEALAEMRTNLAAAFPEYQSLLSVATNEVAFQNWARTQREFPALTAVLTIGPTTEWCGAAATPRTTQDASPTGFLIFAGAAGLLALVYMKVIFGSSTS